MHTIAFGYRKGYGKDFCANYLVQKYGFKRLAFADPLKDAARALFGFSEAQLYGDLKEVEDSFWGFSPRWLLQRLGTDTLRNTFGEICVKEGKWHPAEINQIWVRALLRKRAQVTRGPGVVITDLRFLNEFDSLQKEGAVTVKVIRPLSELGNPTQDVHASEVELDSLTNSKWDIVLRNVGDNYIQVLDTLMDRLEVSPLTPS